MLLKTKMKHILLGALLTSIIAFYANFNQLSFHKRHEIREKFALAYYLQSIIFRGEFCRPKINVGFLKTHKTGSTTVFNILTRFAISNNLPVVTPKPYYSHLCYPYNFSRGYSCMLRPNAQYNMLMNHVRYSEAVRNILPNDTFWFTILRDPLEYFQSCYFYFKIGDEIGADYETFMRNPSAYLPAFRHFSANIRRRNPLFGLAYDLGFENFTEVSSNEVIDFMESEFDFVMIAEYFDQSLAYLRKQLCWSFHDMVYVDQNKRKKKENEMQLKGTEVYQSVIREIIPVYFDAYEYFAEKLREQILSRDDLKSDVIKLQNILEEKRSECFGDGKKLKDERLVPAFQPVPIYTYALKSHSTDCVRIALPESALTDCLRDISHFDHETC